MLLSSQGTLEPQKSDRCPIGTEAVLQLKVSGAYVIESATQLDQYWHMKLLNSAQVLVGLYHFPL